MKLCFPILCTFTYYVVILCSQKANFCLPTQIIDTDNKDSVLSVSFDLLDLQSYPLRSTLIQRGTGRQQGLGRSGGCCVGEGGRVGISGIVALVLQLQLLARLWLSIVPVHLPGYMAGLPRPDSTAFLWPGDEPPTSRGDCGIYGGLVCLAESGNRGRKGKGQTTCRMCP